MDRRSRQNHRRRQTRAPSVRFYPLDIENLFPDAIEKNSANEQRNVDWTLTGRDDIRRAGIRSRREGYIQTLDVEFLTDLANKNSLLIRVQYRPGDFVTAGNVIFDIWSEETVSVCLEDKLLSCFSLGNERTAHQNVVFLADQLVEIVGRALSPGINDPFTAITCLNWLKVATLKMSHMNIHKSESSTGDRVRLYPITFERFVSVVFDQTLPYVCRDRNVALHSMAILTELASETQSFASRKLLVSHMSKLAEAAGSQIPYNAGGREITERYAQALQVLSDPEGFEAYRNDQGWFGGRA